MKRLSLFILLFLLCQGTLLIAQTRGAVLNPAEIDIYTFDPTAGKATDATEFLKQALTAYQKADYETAIRNYLVYLQLKPADSNSWYNLSCCYGLLGKPELAAKYLQIAYKNGFRDLEHIAADPDFAGVKSEKVFVAAIDSLQTWSAKREKYRGKMEYFPLQQFQPYRLLLPENYSKDKTYTLLIGLHGFGDRADNFAALGRNLEKEDIIFVVPEAPYAFPDADIPQYSWDPFLPRDSQTTETSYLYTMKYIVNLATQLKKDYKIGQTWLLGFSQGAYLSYIIGLKNPRTFDGFIACGGGLEKGLLKDKDYKAAKNMKVIISHGSQDKIVDYQESADAAKLLAGKGLDVQFHTFEGGHSVSKEIFPLFTATLKTSKNKK